MTTFLLRKDTRPEMVTEPSAFSDDMLAERVGLGDRNAFAELVQRHSTRFYRVAYRVLKNKDDAEDMVQTAFLKFWQQPQSWDPLKQTKFTTWFYRVVTNLCLDQLKKKKPDLMPEDRDIEDSQPRAEECLDLYRKKKLLGGFLAELPERQRAALNLCFYEGFSNQEAAAMMGVKLKAFQSLLMRAKETLRNKAREMERSHEA